MKSFASPFSIPVLNLNLKSGIWAGITAVSIGSGAITFYNHWSDIEEKAVVFYEKGFKPYVIRPVEKTFIWSYEKVYLSYREIVEKEYIPWFKWTIENNSVIANWIGKSVISQDIFFNLGILFKESFGYVVSAAKLSNKFNWTEENIRNLVTYVVNFFDVIGDITFNLIGGSQEEVEKTFEKISKIIGNEKFFEIVSKTFETFYHHHWALGLITAQDIARIIDMAAERPEAFLENSKNLIENPISLDDGPGVDVDVRISNKQEKKKELIDKLAPPKPTCDSSPLLKGPLCVLGIAGTDVLLNSTDCIEGEDCSNNYVVEETAESIYRTYIRDKLKTAIVDLKTKYESSQLKQLKEQFKTLLLSYLGDSNNGVQATDSEGQTTGSSDESVET